MSYEKVQQAANVIIGTKQTVRALKSKQASEVLVAEDADPGIKSQIIQAANEAGIPVTLVDSMKLLGKECGIDVGAAAVAIIH